MCPAGASYECPAIVHVNIPLNQGWTWVSLNAMGDSGLANVMGSVSAASGDVIKSQFAFTVYYESYGWFGSLTSLPVTSMYKMKLSTAQTLAYAAPAAPLTTPLVWHAGWNFVPFLGSTVIPLATGMCPFAYTNEDTVKSQTAFATYYENVEFDDVTYNGWYGSLTTLSPGEGYMLFVNASGTTSYAAP